MGLEALVRGASEVCEKSGRKLLPSWRALRVTESLMTDCDRRAPVSLIHLKAAAGPLGYLQQKAICTALPSDVPRFTKPEGLAMMILQETSDHGWKMPLLLSCNHSS